NLGIPLAPLRRARRKESVDTEWARIGVVTKKFGQKSLSGITTLRETGHRLPEGAGAASELQWPRTGGVGTAIESPTFPTDINPGAALSWPENRVFRRRFVRSYPNFQLEILRFSTKSIDWVEIFEIVYR
ncbi:serine carboxypeptidase-like 40, partial [Prunus dulcis]